MSDQTETENEIDNTTTAAPQSDDDYLEYAYQTALGRSSDHDGKAYWPHEVHCGPVDRA